VSARGRPPDARPRLLWALLVIAAALIGGLAAAALVHVSLAIAVPVSVVAGGIAVFAAARWPARPTEPGHAQHQRPTQPLSEQRPAPPPPAQRHQQQPAQQPPQQPAQQPRPWSDGRTQAPPESVVQLLPASPNTPWWDAAQAAPPSPGPKAQRTPAPDLSTYLASTIIAQCPNCGAFRLDFRRSRSRNGWDFRCESCRYTWTWQQGTAWPAVRVAPRRRHT
jgi:hypothetical protein